MNKLPKPDLNAPTLIIDDECDQASLNTKEYKNDADDISKTNALLKKLLNDFKNVTLCWLYSYSKCLFLQTLLHLMDFRALFLVIL